MIAAPGYTVGLALGRGRTGSLFRATRDSDGAAVVIRQLTPKLAAAPAVAAALRSLSVDCSTLRAPTVLPVLQVLELDGDLLVVEPYVEGSPLSRVLAGGPLPPEEVHALAMDLMDAVADLHRHRVVHGDLRPSNIHMTARGARVSGVGVALRTKRRAGQGGFLLRDPYDAPELDAGGSGHLIDLYALGAVLLYAITGDEGPHDFLPASDEVTDVLLKAVSAAPERRQGNVEALRLEFLDAEKRRGPAKARPVVPPTLASWAPSLGSTPGAAVPWPEEDDVATRAGFSAVPAGVAASPAGPATLGRTASRPPEPVSFSLAAAPEPADARTPSAPEGGESTAADRAASRSPRVVVHAVVDRRGATVSVLDSRLDAAPTVSARREGTLPPGERLAQLLDELRSRRRGIAGGVAALLALVLFFALRPDHPEGMVLVRPDGPVSLGDPEGQKDEAPGLSLAVAPFLLDSVEVTAGEYRACERLGACSSSALPLPVNDRLPVTGVTWLQAQSYCRSLGRRLPSENEWEAAARRAGRFPWGDAPAACGLAVFALRAGSQCASEGARPEPRTVPTQEERADGAFFDLSGNVWEFVDSEYQPERGPGSGGLTVAGQSALRVIKGGAYSSGVEALRPGARIGVRTDYAAEDVGFRCARDPR